MHQSDTVRVEVKTGCDGCYDKCYTGSGWRDATPAYTISGLDSGTNSWINFPDRAFYAIECTPPSPPPPPQLPPPPSTYPCTP